MRHVRPSTAAALSLPPRRSAAAAAEYAQARATQPVCPVTLWDGRRAWLVTRYEDVRAVVADPRFSGEFANPDFPAVTEARVVVDKQERAFVGMDNPRHDHYRRMFTKEFSTKRMMALRPKIAAIANRLIDELMAQPQPADLVATIAVPFPSLVMCDLVGSPYEDHTFIIECAAGRHGLTADAGAGRAEGARARRLFHAPHPPQGGGARRRPGEPRHRGARAARQPVARGFRGDRRDDPARRPRHDHQHDRPRNADPARPSRAGRRGARRTGASCRARSRSCCAT